jgi:hypothetical protein
MNFLLKASVAGIVLACAPAQADTFFVTTEDSVVKVTEDSAFVFATGLKEPTGIVEDGAGNIYVGNRGANEILEYPIINGAVSSTPIVFASGLHAPQDLAFDHAGNLYEADQGSGTVYKFAFNGTRLSNKANPVITGLADNDRPCGLCFDAQGDLYVAAYIGGILKFTNNGGMWGSPAIFASFSRARQMVFDKHGNLFTADHVDQRVYEFLATPGGLSAKATIFAERNGLNAPGGVAFDSAGNLYVTNWGCGSGTDGLEYPLTGGALSNNPVPFVSGFTAPAYILTYNAPK